jgi:hypothetical protein
MLMKKFLLKAIAIVAAMGFCSTNAMAADPDLANDYTLVKSITFKGDTTIALGASAIAYTAYETGNAKQQQLFDCTAPESASGWIAFQGTGTKGWLNRSGYGLWSYNGTRSAAVYEPTLTTGYLVIFTCTQDPSNVITLTNASGDPDGTFSYVKSEDSKSYICTINAKENAYVGFCGVKSVGYITNISVYKPNKTVVEAKYKVAYVDGDNNVLKDTVEYNGIAGNKVSLSDADKANISYEGYTYLYSSDNSADVTIAEDGSSVATVTFRKAANFTYTVKEVYGDVVLRETTGTSYETASVTVPYRKYNTYEGKLYTKGATDKEYNHKFKLTADNQVETLSYDEVAGVENVVFLTEGEDIEGMTACTTANTAIRSSNSSSAYASEDVKIANLDNGTYKMHAVIYDSAKEPNSNWKFYLNDATQTEAGNFTCTKVNLEEFESEFAVKSSTDLMFSAAGSALMGIDMLYIVKTGDYKYFDVESTLPDTITVKYGEDEFPNLCNDYVSVETNAMSVSKKLGLAKVLAGIDKKEVEYNMLGSMDEVLAFTTQSGPGIYYAFVNIEAQFDENTDSSYVSDTIVINVVEGNYLKIESWLPDTITYTKGDPDMPQLSDYYIYESSQKDESKFTATMGLVKVEPGTPKDAVEYNIYDSEMAVKMAFVQGGVGTYYAFGKVTVEYDDQTTETVTTDTIVIEIKEKEVEPIVSTHTWDFTNFSEATIANLKAEAVKVTVTDVEGKENTTKCVNNDATWSDHEKAPGKECDTYALSKDKCFWFFGSANADGQLEANGEVIEELKGLTFNNSTYNASRAIALAVDYGSTSLGTYEGGSYLWMGGKNGSFTIKNVVVGSEITIGVESHKLNPADPRGVKLTLDGVELKDGNGNAVTPPTTYTEQTWIVSAAEAVGAKADNFNATVSVPEVVDVVVTNTNGCHIYWIDALVDDTATAVEAVTEEVKAAAPAKFIKNGKLIIATGDKQFNAAGAQLK